jgi:membrane-associated phospholipid phosphatase
MSVKLDSHPLLAGATAAAALFVALAGVAAMDEPTALDRAVHDLAERNYRRAIEIMLSPIEIIGLPGLYIPIAVLLARRLQQHRRRGGPAIVASAATGWLALRATRLVYQRTRPPRPRHRGPKRESSFPSGHTTGITALSVGSAIVLGSSRMLSTRAALGVALGVPLLTGFNRVYVREHWATDVFGGWLLGGAVGLACAVLADR